MSRWWHRLGLHIRSYCAVSDVFHRAAKRIENSSFVIPIFGVFVIMLVVGVGIFIEDYSTSLAGYQQLPTRKVNEWVIGLVALLPQIGQIGFMYVFATDTNKRWAILITAGLHLVDVATDVIYKASGLGFEAWAVALVESEIVYAGQRDYDSYLARHDHPS